ncbi:hypothetical protein ACFE04_004284 [Oxalis oulophora]
MSSNIDQDPSTSSCTPSSTRSSKLRKIPPIPVQRNNKNNGSDDDEEEDSGDDANNEDDSQPIIVDDVDDGNISSSSDTTSFSSPIILASSLGLNHIRTRSAPSPSPLRFFSSAGTPSNIADVVCSKEKASVVDTKLKLGMSHNQSTSSLEPCKKVAWSQSRSLRNPSLLNPVLEGTHAAFAKEINSPRFQAVMHVTSSRKKKAQDIKAFSHELNSKGVRPFPVWKSRAMGHMEEIMVAVREKFDRLKEEVNSDLGIFAGDLVGILEKSCGSNPRWKESLEDLLIVARQCAKMTPSEFWVKCERIVQILDDKRQELPMSVLKQAHTRLLFILTRCTRLVQFQKESGYEDDHILGLHQLSDLGVYPEQILEIARQEYNNLALSGEKDVIEKEKKKSHGQEQPGELIIKEEKVDQFLTVALDSVEVSTAKSVDSNSSSYKMSSWKKLPSTAKKKSQKSHETPDTPTKEHLSNVKDDTKTETTENTDTPSCIPASSGTRKVTWGFWGENHNNISYENSMICRICEVEIPVVHVEEHSWICTIADRCDLKGLTVNERLERVAETLEKILETWTPKSIGSPSRSPEIPIESAPNVAEIEFDELSPQRQSPRYEDMIDCIPDDDNGFVMEDLNVLPDISSEAQCAMMPDSATKSSSGGSLTPRSPLLTPRTAQIELLLSKRRMITELEKHQQINKLQEIARSIANVNDSDYGALEYMLHYLDELKYAIQDRKVDALVVETFGRRIEKLLQEKYVHVCSQIDDEKADSSNAMADEESSIDDDTVRSLRASPINKTSKDRTSIEDFEIIKPISRGAFGRVFLARKRATGDLFAIKVLRKADMIRKNSVERILSERNILISLRNPFVVSSPGISWDNLYLVMEYLNGGDLYSLLRNLGCLDEDMARVYMAEVVLALEYLHSLNVIHRDLKPDNLLIGQDGHIKLTDFGLSKVGLIDSTDDLSGVSAGDSGFTGDNEPKSQAAKKEQRKKHSVVGTPDYLAPEILLGMGHGATADWWSVGIILFELLVGVPPFNAESPQLIFDNIMNRDIPWPKVPDDLSYEATDLIDKLLTENSIQRLGATGAKEVKAHPFFKDINWDTLARQKAMFIPEADAHDTSYFMSRYIWNPDEEHLGGGSDFDDMTDTCSSGSYSLQDEDVDECSSLAEFSGPTLTVKYSFSNFSFKNLSQLASINYDLVVKSNKEATEITKPSAS